MACNASEPAPTLETRDAGVTPAVNAGNGGSGGAGRAGGAGGENPTSSGGDAPSSGGRRIDANGGAPSMGGRTPTDPSGEGGSSGAADDAGASPIHAEAGTAPPKGNGPFFGVRPVAGTPASIGNTRIFDDLAGLVWNRTREELLFVVGQNNQIRRYRTGLADAQNFDVVRPGGEQMDEMKGLDLGPDGALWVCEARYSLPHRVSRSTDGYDHPVTVVDHWQASPSGPAMDFTSPWYVAVRWDGNAYFTDTPHRYSGAPDKRLFRVDPTNHLSLLKQYATDADQSEGGAFGIALSPNQRAFYVSTWNHPGYPQLVRFDLDDDGAVAKETLFMTDKDGPIQSVDGLCVDQGENLYLCTGGGGVRMYGPAGDFLGSIDVPGATDCTFGGTDMKTLFVGTSGSVAGDKNLYQVPMNIPGLP
jgi:sugar lactone lactonase YvrE